LVVLAVLATGCTGGTLHPSFLPDLTPAGDGGPEHARSSAHSTDSDPHALRLEVRPTEIAGPAGTQRVLLATVYDENGQPRRGRRVEWLLEGVGTILAVDESGYLAAKGYKVDSRYAVTFTDYVEHRITRGDGDPHDDFMARPGQSWCVISSAVEGETKVTAYAPGIADWAARTVVVTARWTDTDCQVPPPSSHRAGTEAVLSTRVRRHSDGKPLANYQVRYRLLDGPPVRLGPPTDKPPADAADTLKQAVAVSDSSGVAAVRLAQPEARPGVSRVAVEVVRPPDPDGPNRLETVVYRGETTLEWQAPQLGLSVAGPSAAVVGQEVPFTLTVSSTGSLETPPLTVQQAVPDGWLFVRSDPPAAQEGDRVIWTLAGLGAGRSQELRAVLKPTRTGPVSTDARVSTAEGLSAEARTQTRVSEAQLKLTVSGPPAAAAGDAVNYRFQVSNPGSGPATNVKLTVNFDPGLEHESKLNPLETVIDQLGPGATETVPLTLTARRTGRQVLRVAVGNAAGLADKGECATEVRARQLELALAGPERQYVGRDATWDVTVRNAGEVPLGNVVVRDRLPEGVAFKSATADGRPDAGGEVVWYVPTLAPGESRALKVTGACQKATVRAATAATAAAAGVPEQRAEAVLDVLGVPALHLDLGSTGNPAQVGGTVGYQLRAVNQGSLPAVQVELTAEVPKSLKVLRGTGPGQPKVEGQTLTFPAVASIPPGQSVEYTVEAQALEPGDGRFHAELRSSVLSSPVVAQEATTVLRKVGEAR
jgi:uncharacterized repeat protein (TIGR01451 family)